MAGYLRSIQFFYWLSTYGHIIYWSTSYNWFKPLQQIRQLIIFLDFDSVSLLNHFIYETFQVNIEIGRASSLMLLNITASYYCNPKIKHPSEPGLLKVLFIIADMYLIICDAVHCIYCITINSFIKNTTWAEGSFVLVSTDFPRVWNTPGVRKGNNFL